MRTMVLMLLMFAFLAAIALGLTFIPLPKPFPEAMSSGRNSFAAFVTGTLGMILLIWFSIGFFCDVFRARNLLDPFLDHEGFKKEAFFLAGRRYYGTIDNLPIEVIFHPRYRFEPALLSIKITKSFPHELALTKSKPQLYCRHCPEIIIYNDLNFRAFCEEPDFVHSYFSDHTVLDILRSLFSEDFKLLDIYFTKTFFYIRIRTYIFSGGQFHTILNSCIKLAESLG